MLCQPRTALNTTLIANDIEKFRFGLFRGFRIWFLQKPETKISYAVYYIPLPAELNQPKSRTCPMIPEERTPGRRMKGTKQCG